MGNMSSNQFRQLCHRTCENDETRGAELFNACSNFLVFLSRQLQRLGGLHSAHEGAHAIVLLYATRGVPIALLMLVQNINRGLLDQGLSVDTIRLLGHNADDFSFGIGSTVWLLQELEMSCGFDGMWARRDLEAVLYFSHHVIHLLADQQLVLHRDNLPMNLPDLWGNLHVAVNSEAMNQDDYGLIRDCGVFDTGRPWLAVVNEPGFYRTFRHAFGVHYGILCSGVTLANPILTVELTEHAAALVAAAHVLAVHVLEEQDDYDQPGRYYLLDQEEQEEEEEEEKEEEEKEDELDVSDSDSDSNGDGAPGGWLSNVRVVQEE